MRTVIAAVAGLLVVASAASAEDRLADLVRTGDRDAAIAMIEAGADVNAGDANGATALHYAAHRGDAELVERLLAAGADPNGESAFGSTPMREAAELGDADVIAALLEAGADPDSASPEGQTALMAVARTGRVDAARLLVRAGADVNAVETWGGQTALMWAAAQHQPEMIAYLIEAGADPSIQATARDWERRLTSEPRIKEFDMGGFTALLYAAREGCVDCARALVEGGADPDQADPMGVTPVIISLLNFRYDTAAYLIDAGADPNVYDWWGRAPLYTAIDMIRVPDSVRADMPTYDQTPSHAIVAMLLEKGANPNFTLKHYPLPRNIAYGRGRDNLALNAGTTPLVRAAYGADVESVRMLLEHDVHVNLANMNGITPILAASGDAGTRAENKPEADIIATLELLIEAGGDMNAQDRSGQSALHKAARQGWNDVVRYLCEQGADLHLTDGRGLTARDYAAGQSGNISFGNFDPGVERNETVAIFDEYLAREAAETEQL